MFPESVIMPFSSISPPERFLTLLASPPYAVISNSFLSFIANAKSGSALQLIMPLEAFKTTSGLFWQ